MMTEVILNDKERIEALLEYLKVSKNRLGVNIGDQNGMRFQHVVNGRNEISEKLAKDIVATYPEVRIDWLLKGTGDMIERKGNHVYDAEEITSINGGIKINKSGNEFMDLNNGKYLMLVPLVENYAQGGYPASYADPTFIEEMPKHPIVVDSKHRGIYRAFPVIGNSMEYEGNDSIAEGDIVVGRQIDQVHWHSRFHIHKFKDYIIVANDGITVKRIKNHDVENGILTCECLNPDKDRYPDFEMNLQDVKQILNVISVTKKR